MCAIHISNRYLDLQPVVKGLAGALGLRGALFVWLGREGAWPSDWILLTQGGRLLDDPQVASGGAALSVGDSALPVWTDGYSDLLRVIKR